MPTIDPSLWHASAKNRHKKKPYYTQWLPGTVAPTRRGVYERYYTDGIYRHYWDGHNWRSQKESVLPHWRQVGDYPAWRGLTAMGFIRNKP